MEKTLKQFTFLSLLIVAAIAIPHLAIAADIIPSSNPFTPIGEATRNETSLREIVLTMINFFLTFLGIVAVIMIIYAGVIYTTSGGEDEKMQTAKKTIMYAAIGLVIVLLSYAIVNMIVGAGTGTET